MFLKAFKQKFESIASKILDTLGTAAQVCPCRIHKTDMKPNQNGKRSKKGCYTPRGPLLAPGQEHFLALSRPQYVRETAQIWLKMGRMCDVMPHNPRTKDGPYLWLGGRVSDFRGHLVHQQSPTFCGFQLSKSPNETPRPPHHWLLGGAEGQPAPCTVGANGRSTRVTGAKRCSNQCFSPLLSSC